MLKQVKSEVELTIIGVVDDEKYWLDDRNFDDFDKLELKNYLLSLCENSTVILVQSTNFRLDDFRIRLMLHKS